MNKTDFYKAAGGLVRIGKVSSVDVENRTARVIYEDRGDVVSGELKVLQNQPYIHADFAFKGSSFSREASYATIDRELGYSGESFDGDNPDTITLSQDYSYNMECSECDAGTETASHTAYFEIHPWLPKIDQQVVVLLLPSYDGGGVILGGL